MSVEIGNIYIYETITLGDTFLELAMVENRRFAVEISMSSVNEGQPEIEIVRHRYSTVAARHQTSLTANLHLIKDGSQSPSKFDETSIYFLPTIS